MDVRKIQCETGIPAAHAFGGSADKIGRVFDSRAEAGRADICAIAAGKATLGNLVPAWVVRVAAIP
jgi:hypothetical protein